MALDITRALVPRDEFRRSPGTIDFSSDRNRSVETPAPPAIADFATLRLLACWRMQAKFSLFFQSFRSPRRRWIALLAIVLGTIWLGQAVVSMLFRQPADPALLAIWIPFSLAAYSAWHFIKSICSKATEPFDWTSTETEILCAAPFSRSQLICYRLQTTVISALAKSLCFTLVMFPDLKFVLAGFVGMFAGLMLVELFRMMVQIASCGVSNRTIGALRILTFTGFAAWFGYVLVSCLGTSGATSQLASPGAFLFAQELGKTLFQHVTGEASWLLIPFMPAAKVMLTDSLDIVWMAQVLLSFLLVAGGLMGVIGFDRQFSRISQQRERTELERIQRKSAQLFSDLPITRTTRAPRRIFVPIRLMGAGSIAWRQLLGAWHYRGTLAISLGVPVILCCLPMLANHQPLSMLMQIVGGLVFYSFLLLPAALMLDFRRDANRLAVLKALPITPMAVTIGQLAAPVLICFGFQTVVLIIGALSGSITIAHAMLAGVLMWPVCCLIFATENLIFMVSPHRLNQEGLDVFLRTILVFTAKGIFLALALAGALGWAVASRNLSQWFVDPITANGIIFVGGMWLVTFGLAAGATLWLAKLFEQFDPSLDAAQL